MHSVMRRVLQLWWLAMQVSKMALAERKGEHFEDVFGESLSTTAISARGALVLERLGALGVRNALREIVADADRGVAHRFLSWCVLVGTTDGDDAAWLAEALQGPATEVAPSTYAVGLRVLQEKHADRLSEAEGDRLSRALTEAEGVARAAVAELLDQDRDIGLPDGQGEIAGQT